MSERSDPGMVEVTGEGRLPSPGAPSPGAPSPDDPSSGRAGARPPAWLLPFVLLLAAALRILCWDRTVVMMNDGADFLWQAQRILAGEWRLALAHDYHPGFGAAIALAAPLGDDLANVAAGLSVLGGVLLTLAAWGLGACAFPGRPWVAACTALVAAGHTRFVHHGADVHPEGLFLGLVGLAAWSAWRAPQTRRPAVGLLAAGVLTGLGFLLRQEALVLGLPLLLWWLAGTVRAAVGAPRFSGLVVFGLGTLVGIAPYSFAIHEMTGTWALSMKPSMSMFALGELPRDRPEGLKTAPHYMPELPPPSGLKPRLRGLYEEIEVPGDGGDAPAGAGTTGGPVKRGALVPPLAMPGGGEDLPRALRPLEKTLRTLRVEGMILLAFGVTAALRRRRGLVAMIATVVGVYLALLAGHLARHGFLSDRHVMLVLVLMLPLLGAGLESMVRGDWRARAGPLRRHGTSLLLALMTVSLLMMATWPRRDDRVARLQALAWVRERVTAEHTVGVQRRRDSWYLQRTVLKLRIPCDKSVLLAMMDEYDTACLVVDLDRVEDHLQPWIDDGTFETWRRFDANHEEDEPVLVLRRPAP